MECRYKFGDLGCNLLLEEGEREEQIGEDKNMKGFFANSCQYNTTWHATSVLEAGVARLGPRMEHLTKFWNLVDDLRV